VCSGTAICGASERGCFSTQRTHKWSRSLHHHQHNSGNNEWPNELLCYQRFDDAIINGANARKHGGHTQTTTQSSSQLSRRGSEIFANFLGDAATSVARLRWWVL